MTRPPTDDTAAAPVTARRLDAVLARAQRGGRLPSVVAGVVRDGSLLWCGSAGEVTGGPPAGPDLQYRIGSITKTLTSVLVLQLRDAGHLDLADPVGRFVPGVGYADLTLRSLLAHAGGMQSEPEGSWWERSPGVSFEQLAALHDGSGAVLPFGQQHHYSNLGYALLGEVAARVHGSPWRELVVDKILSPLGMERTSYLPDAPAARGFSVHHFAGTLTDEPATDTGAMAPAGQLWSTVPDLARYATFLMEGHPGVLSRGSLLEASIPQSGTLAGLPAGSYGLGFRLLRGGSGVLAGHTGSMPGFLATLFVDRGRRTAALALANGTAGMSTEGLAVELLDTLEDSEPTVVEPWRPTESVPAEVEGLLGVWHWGNTAYGFSYEEGELVVRALHNGGVSHRFGVDAAGSLVGTAGYHLGETLHVRRRPDGSISHLVCATFVYTRTPYDPETPIPGGHPG